MKQILKESYRRSFENRIKTIVKNHKKSKFIPNDRLPMLKPSNDKTEQVAIQIYESKCEENEVITNLLSQQKFVSQFISSITKKTRKFTGLGLGPKSISQLIEFLKENSNFVYLDLSLNRIQLNGSIKISEYLKKNKNLIYLDLRSNSLTPDCCSKIFDNLINNTHLVFIDFSAIGGINRNRIGIEGCKSISQLLNINNTLTHLNISMCGISFDGCQSLSPILSSLTNLIHLDLSGNGFGNIGLINLLNGVGSLAQLEYLNLSNNSLSDQTSLIFCQRLSQTPTLKFLDLSKNFFGEHFIKKLFNVIGSKNSNIEHLNINNNKITYFSAESIQSMITEDFSLIYLDISSNPLKDDSIISICQALPSNLFLKVLNFSDTSIGDLSAIALSNVILKSKTLEKIYLDSNKITDKGGEKLAISLLKNKSINTISLKSNELGDESGKKFIEVLQTNKKITSLDLNYNNFDYEIYQKITTIIKEHTIFLENNKSEIVSDYINNLENIEEEFKNINKEIIYLENKTIEEKYKLLEKQQLLKEIHNKREKQKFENNLIINKIKEENDKIDKLQRETTIKMATVKVETEDLLLIKSNELQEQKLKKQHSESHLKRVESIKLDLKFSKSKILDDLQLHFQFLKEQLNTTINEAIEIKQRILEEENLKNNNEKLEKLIDLKDNTILTIEELKKKKKMKKKKKYLLNIKKFIIINKFICRSFLRNFFK